MKCDEKSITKNKTSEYFFDFDNYTTQYGSKTVEYHFLSTLAKFSGISTPKILLGAPKMTFKCSKQKNVDLENEGYPSKIDSFPCKNNANQRKTC